MKTLTDFCWKKTLFASIGILMINSVNAVPLSSTIELDGHRYYLSSQTAKNWNQARVIAAKETVQLADGTLLKGHLVTINSQIEQDFIANNFMTSNFRHLLLGAYQFSNAVEPEGNWAWVTGEEIGSIDQWSYHFMDTNQPGDDDNPTLINNANPFNREDTLQMLINSGTGAPIGTGADHWNDFNRGASSGSVDRFVIEFDSIGDNFIKITGLPSITSGAHWRSSDTNVPGWETISFDDSSWDFARSPYPTPNLPSNLITNTNAEFMWHDPNSTSDGANGSLNAFFRFTFDLNLTPESRPIIGKAQVVGDDDYDVYLNGQLIHENHDNGFSGKLDTIDFAAHLREGKNVIAIHAVDGRWGAPSNRLFESILFDAKLHPLSDLLVLTATETGFQSIPRYEGQAGALIDHFSSGCDPSAMTFGPDGQFYVAYRDKGSFGSCVPTQVVSRVSGRTGDLDFSNLDPHRNYIPLSDPRFIFGVSGMAFGPDGNLYLSDQEDNSIHRYQGPFGINPGQYIDTFVSNGTGGLSEPRTLLFGSEGDLYIHSKSNRVLRFHGPLNSSPGTLVNTFVPTGSEGLNGISNMKFGPDGRLYIASSPGNILRYQGPSQSQPGNFIDTFITSGNGGFDSSASAFAFSPSGDIYVGGRTEGPIIKNAIFRYSGQTGQLINIFADLQHPARDIIFSAIPDPANNLGDFNNDGCIDRSDLIQNLYPVIRARSNDLNFDLSGDGLVNIVDARKLMLLFSQPRGAACN